MTDRAPLRGTSSPTCPECNGRGYIDVGAGDVNPPGAPEHIEVPCDFCNTGDDGGPDA